MDIIIKWITEAGIPPWMYYILGAFFCAYGLIKLGHSFYDMRLKRNEFLKSDDSREHEVRVAKLQLEKNYLDRFLHILSDFRESFDSLLVSLDLITKNSNEIERGLVNEPVASMSAKIGALIETAKEGRDEINNLGKSSAYLVKQLKLILLCILPLGIFLILSGTSTEFLQNTKEAQKSQIESYTRKVNDLNSTVIERNQEIERLNEIITSKTSKGETKEAIQNQDSCPRGHICPDTCNEAINTISKRLLDLSKLETVCIGPSACFGGAKDNKIREALKSGGLVSIHSGRITISGPQALESFTLNEIELGELTCGDFLVSEQQ